MELLENFTWDDLLSRYRPLLPWSIKLVSACQLMKCFPGLEENLRVDLFVERSEWEAGKGGAAVMKEWNDYSVGYATITAFCPRDSTKETVQMVLDCLEREVNWDSRQVFHAQEDLMEQVEELCVAKRNKVAVTGSNRCGGGGGGGSDTGAHRQAEWEALTEVFVLTSEQDLPEVATAATEQLELRPLGKEQHLEMVVSNWGFSRSYTVRQMGAMVDRGLCYGAFRDDGEIVSWVCTMRYGSIGILFTPERHRRKGFARACVVELSRRLLSLGLTPYAYVEEDNSASKRLFNALGFRPAQMAKWIGYLPPGIESEGRAGCCH